MSRHDALPFRCESSRSVSVRARQLPQLPLQARRRQLAAGEQVGRIGALRRCRHSLRNLRSVGGPKRVKPASTATAASPAGALPPRPAPGCRAPARDVVARNLLGRWVLAPGAPLVQARAERGCARVVPLWNAYSAVALRADQPHRLHGAADLRVVDRHAVVERVRVRQRGTARSKTPSSDRLAVDD